MTPSTEDHIAIQNLLYRYADAADRRDAARMNRCFANAQVRITGPGIVVDDGDKMIGMLAEMFDWTMHNVHNFAFEVDKDGGERAHGYTYCVATHVRTENGVRSKIDMYIRYLDELIKENGEWVFVKRELDVGLHDVAVLA
ncbi:MAG TPA: nuclear transport factor 2 family protein [Thauera sp.]|jgi:hypothetical protein|nr:nuclear transport factor 2 family protein [Thauera sp.]HRA80664.1 nuclear transport factor 2 family protein [Thauera sp.]